MPSLAAGNSIVTQVPAGPSLTLAGPAPSDRMARAGSLEPLTRDMAS